MNNNKFSKSKKIGYYQKRKIRRIFFLALLGLFIYWYYYADIYVGDKIDRYSTWYVNDLYMSNQYYYNNLLKTEEEKEAYIELFDGIKNNREKIIINQPYNIVSKSWDALICDHPEMINMTTFYYYSEDAKTTITPTYLTKSKILLKLKERRMLRTVKDVVEATEGMTDFEKERYIYEWLGTRNSYGYGLFSSDQSAYTAFAFESNTVCAGFGKAAQILLNNCGVSSIININSNHIWNTVKLDNEYYFFDSTAAAGGRIDEDLKLNINYDGLNRNKYSGGYTILYPEVLPDVSGTKYNYNYYKDLPAMITKK